MENTPPIPDVSGLPVEANTSQYALQNASAAMAPQPQPPPTEQPYVQDQNGATLAMGGAGTGDTSQPTANPTALKSLLTNFFGQHGVGGYLMNSFGMPTPEQRQIKQQNLQLKQQMDQSTIQYHQAAANALNQENESVDYPISFNPDGTPSQTVKVLKKGLPALAAKQMGINANPNLQYEAMTPEDAKLFPGVPAGTMVPKQMLAASRLKTAGQLNVQAQKPIKPSASSRDDRYIALQGVDPKTWSTEDRQFMKGYEKFVDFTKIAPGVERAKIFAAPRWASLDPDLQARIALAKGMATGPLANQLSSFNAFVGHLGDFHDAAQELKNSDYKLYNTAINEISIHTGDPEIQGIIAKIEPVRKEFESLLLNNRALYDADRKSADVILNPASSPRQLEEAVRSLAGTAAIRLGAVNQNVKRITQTDIPELLEPANGAILEELGAEIPGYSGSQQDFGTTFKNPLSPTTRKTGGGSRKPTHRFNPATNKIEAY